MKKTALFVTAAVLLPLYGAAAAVPLVHPKTSPLLSSVLFGKKKKEEVQVHPQGTEETFAAAARTHKIILMNNPQLEADIQLPADWQEWSPTGFAPVIPGAGDTKKSIEHTTAENKIKFVSPMILTYQPSLTVMTMQVDYDIALQHWLKNYIIINGLSPDGDVALSEDGRKATISFSHIVDGISYYTTITAMMSGSSVVTATFESPLPLKDYISFVQQKVIGTFKLASPVDSPVEKQTPVSLADAVKLTYPASWTGTMGNIRDLNRLSLRLNNKDATGKLQGTIQVTAVRRTRSTRLMDEAATVRSFFGDLGFTISDLVSSGEMPDVSKRFIFNRHEIYTLKKEGQKNQNLHLLMLGDASWYVIAFLVTPTETDNFATWARNTRSFDLVAQSIR